MKLRIKGDSLRMRVSRSELDCILRGERVAETIHFSSDRDAKLTYSLENASQGASTGVLHSPGQVAILTAKDDVDTWGDPSQVGIYTSVENGSKGLLELVIEKDFACLDRSDEDNTDTFANPHATAVC